MLQTVLLCVSVAIVARCDLTSSLSLPEAASTTLRLTAQRNDTGSWTTRFGDYQMTIEHRHFNSSKDNYDEEGTWTIKVKHTCTTYPDGTTIVGHDVKESGQLATINNKLIGDNILLPSDTATGESIQDAILATEDHYIHVEAELPLSTNISKETQSFDNDPPHETTVERRTESPDNGNIRTEQEELLAPEGESAIVERYPRSEFLARYITEHENYSKGYKFYVGIGWLKLNTSDWQWPEAKAACEEYGGHLAIPDTVQKMGVFTQILKQNADVLKRAVLKNQVFIGVFYPENSRTLTTVLGKLFQPESDSVWFPDEPNNAPPGEDCITLHLEGRLRDVPCFYNLPFLCQID